MAREGPRVGVWGKSKLALPSPRSWLPSSELGVIKGSALGWRTWGSSTLRSDLTAAEQPSRLQLEESQFYLLL